MYGSFRISTTIMNLRQKKVNALQRGDIIAVVQYNGFSFAIFWGWEGNGYTSKDGQDRKAWYYTIPEWDESLTDVREFLDIIIAGKNRFFPGNISWTTNYAEQKVLPIPKTYLSEYQQEYVNLLNNQLR